MSAFLTDAGIESRPVWKPLHLQPVFAGFPGAINGSAERLFDQGLTLPSGSGMSHEEFAEVEATLTAALQGGAAGMRPGAPVVPRQVARNEQARGVLA